MAVDPLATLADLEGFGIAVPDDQAVLAERLIESVTSQVREAAGSAITEATSDVVLPGTREQFLPLPGGPIRSVSSVHVDGLEVTDFKVRSGRLWRPWGWRGQHVDVTVVWTHGLPEAPADITKLVCTLVAAGLHEQVEGIGERRGRQYMSIDDYREGFTTGDTEIVDLTELPERTRRMLASRFGGGAHVVGTY